MKKFVKALVVVSAIIVGITYAGVALSTGASVSGEILEVDAEASMVTVKTKGGEVVLTVNDKTVIKAGKEKKTLADVKVGDRVECEHKDGMCLKLEIK